MMLHSIPVERMAKSFEKQRPSNQSKEETMMSIATAMNVRLSIPRPFNGGEWRLSRLVAGPRGGKNWETIQSIPATGGEYCTRLPEGVYKETWWSNGRPSSSTFTIKKVKTYTD